MTAAAERRSRRCACQNAQSDDTLAHPREGESEAASSSRQRTWRRRDLAPRREANE
jgi:hypothetical protein